MSALETLLARVKAARSSWDGPASSEVLAACGLDVARHKRGWRLRRGSHWEAMPRVTHSLDDALWLVERCKPEWAGPVSLTIAGSAVAVLEPRDPCGLSVQALGNTPALAVCAALLEALLNGEGTLSGGSEPKTAPPVEADAAAIERAVDEIIERQPPTPYSFVAQNAAVERERRIKYARTIGRQVARALARRAQAAEGERDLHRKDADEFAYKSAVSLTRAEAAEADAARLREALIEAANQFAFYAEEHAKKGTPEATRKAETNHSWALLCAEAADTGSIITAARGEGEGLREALEDATAHLIASVSLLKAGGKKAAASNKVFELMLADYDRSIERARAALSLLPIEVDRGSSLQPEEGRPPFASQPASDTGEPS